MTATISEKLDLVMEAMGFGFLLTLFLASIYLLA